MPPNRFKASLRSDKCQLGFWSTFGSSIAIEAMGFAGFDFIVLDTEHGPADPLVTLTQLQALSGTPASACVRVVANEQMVIKKTLDIGAETLIIPQVDSVDDARRAIASVRFPPNGIRGISTTARASRYGAIKDYHHQAGSEVCPILMIESRKAIAALPDILTVEGVDAILFGPQDLAADMGCLLRPGTPEVIDAIEKGVALALASGKSPGVAVGTESDALHWFKRGAKFVTCGSDVSLLARGAEALNDRLRAQNVR